MLDGRGWDVVPELSYSEYGERGRSTSSGGTRRPTLLIIEVKTRSRRSKRPCASTMPRRGWVPGSRRPDSDGAPRPTARLLVLPEHRTIRRQIEDKRSVFGRAYPERTVAVRAWLRAPDRPMAGLMFLSDSDLGRGLRESASRKRVRVVRSSVARARTGDREAEPARFVVYDDSDRYLAGLSAGRTWATSGSALRAPYRPCRRPRASLAGRESRGWATLRANDPRATGGWEQWPR